MDDVRPAKATAGYTRAPSACRTAGGTQRARRRRATVQSQARGTLMVSQSPFRRLPYAADLPSGPWPGTR
jgi:hypothetical protein